MEVNAAINFKNLGAGSSDVKPVETEALANGLSVSETAVCEAGTGLGEFCPSFRNQVWNACD
jgi:hypothetical protein